MCFQLENEEVPAQPVAMAMIVPPAPPPYESETASGVTSDTQPGNSLAQCLSKLITVIFFSNMSPSAY